jgi:hypothetical protein
VFLPDARRPYEYSWKPILFFEFIGRGERLPVTGTNVFNLKVEEIRASGHYAQKGIAKYAFSMCFL